MSNNQMVSVPRDWLNRVALLQMPLHELQDQAVGYLCEPCDAPAEQHQGEPVACVHEWIDDGEFMLVCTACGAQENHDPKWRDMATAPRDGALVRLLVEFTEHATEDSEAMPSPTIGANSFDHTGEDLWQFAGWSWEQDCFTQGAGEPVGWLPLLDTPHADPAEVERLSDQVAAWQALAAERLEVTTGLRTQLAEAHALLDRVVDHAKFWHDHPYAEVIQGVAEDYKALSASAEPSAPTWACQSCQLEQPTDRPCDVCGGKTEPVATKS